MISKETGEDFLILVDENDNPIGKMEKTITHQQGILHRAFSVFIFNTKGEMLLQQRALNKYHSGGLWTNTCCSHPRYGEELNDAANRRLFEEMGMSCKLEYAFNFIYKVNFENGLTEHEFDHVFIGISDTQPLISKDEVSNWKYVKPEDIISEMDSHPEYFTEWFKIAFTKVLKYNNELNYASV